MPGPRVQMVRLFLVFTYIWQEDVAKITKVPGATRNVNPAEINMVSERNHLMYGFSTTIHLHLASFYSQNTFEKKLARGNAHGTTILNLI